MKAIVVKKFSGVPDGKVHAEDFRPKDVVEGRLAGVAVTQGWAVPEGGELPPDPAVLRAEADAKIKRINEELEKLRNAVEAEKAEITASVKSAKDAAEGEIEKINDTITSARTAADAELDTIRAEVEAAKKAATEDVSADAPKAKTKIEKE